MCFFLKELNSITYFSNGAKDNGVVLFKHNANIERLVAIIKLDKHHQSTTYGQETIHGVGKEKDRTYICFPNKGLAILAPKRGLMHQALDVLGGKDSMKSLPTCLHDAQNIDQSLLLIGYGDLTDLEEDFEGSDLQKHLSKVCATMSEESREIRMNLQATALNNNSSEHTENAAKGIMSMIAMSSPSTNLVPTTMMHMELDSAQSPVMSLGYHYHDEEGDAALDAAEVKLEPDAFTGLDILTRVAISNLPV